MLVTKILKDRGRGARFTVYVDRVPAFTVSDVVLQKYPLHPGQEIDEKTVEAVTAAEAFEGARRTALNFLSYRPRSSREVYGKLVSKGCDADLARRVVDHLREMKLLNDLEFARMFVRDKMRGKPMGRTMMRRKLIEKGITPALAERAIGESVTSEREQEAAASLAARKLKTSSRFAKLDRAGKRKHLFNYLLNRGFSSEIASRTVRTMLA